MSINSQLPPTRANIAAQSGEHVALFDCFECANGVYVPGPRPSCSSCGAEAPPIVMRVMTDLAKKRTAA